MGRLLHDRGPGVVVLVDPVTEAHQLDAVLLVLHLGDEPVDVTAAGLDALQHLEHRLVGAAVQRTEQGVDAGRDRGEQVGVARADQAHRRRRAVLLVVGVQDEQQVQRPDHHRVEPVGLGREAERHLQEVLDQPEAVVGVEERLAHRLLVGVGGDGGQLGQQPDRRDLDLLRVEGVEAVLVEGRQRADRARQHRHRVRVAGEAVEEPLQVLVQHRVPADGLVELAQLGRRSAARRRSAGSWSRGRCWTPRAARSGTRGSAGCPCRRRCR